MSFSSLYLPLLTVIVAISSRPCTAAGAEAPSVSLSHGGQVRGIEENSLNGKLFYSYLGIPFAEPPVDRLRFKDPVPAQPWKGILNATKAPVNCLQSGFFDVCLEPRHNLNLQGAEDCLYLNVYTKSPNETQKLPVMVYIHGGGFIYGAAYEYSPHPLMDKDIVLVIIQYRLGIFGFLSTEDAVMPGNMELKDQQLALKWVHENIAKFVGDPDTVTIFGQSAGGAAVHYHILSPGSKGLFKRAILQSGTALCPWVTNLNHRKFAIATGGQFNCSIDHGSKRFLECLQNVDAFYLLVASLRTPLVGIWPMYVLARVDGEFLSQPPEILMKEGKYNKVDVMAGTTRDEGALMILMIELNPKVTDRINNNFTHYGPLSILTHEEKNAASLAKKIYQFYLKRKDVIVQESDRLSILRMHSDRHIVEPNDAVAHMFLKNSTNLFLYQLDHLAKFSFLDIFPHIDKTNIVSHGDDLLYLFEKVSYLPALITDTADLKVREIILSLFTNFAKNGNPNSPELGFVWEKATKKNFNHLSLTLNPTMKVDEFQEERKFWSSLRTRRNLNLQKGYSYPIIRPPYQLNYY